MNLNMVHRGVAEAAPTSLGQCGFFAGSAGGEFVVSGVSCLDDFAL
jgi:hypothetical protein